MYMYYLLGHRLMELPISVDRKEVLAENTYILTLDGDIDFQPPAVRCVVYTLDAFFRQIKSFRRFCLAFGFGLQTYYLIDFS